METIWIILGVLALISLIVYWSGKNSVWGGLTLGTIVGFVVTFFIGFDWYVVLKGAISGTLIGFLADLLGKVSDKIRTK